MDFKKYYFDSSFPGSFGGVNNFYRSLKQQFPNVKRKQVVDFLKSNDSYTLHKPPAKIKLFRRVYTKNIGYLYQIDLVDMSTYKDENDGYTFIITCIDTFSKKAWVFKLKNKTGSSIVKALKVLLLVNRHQKIEFDQGTEFYNSKFLNLLKTYGIQHYSIFSDRKCSIVERFNRTLKTRMFRAFTAQGNHRYIDILDDIVASYNQTKHSSTKFAPDDVTSLNENIVRKNLYPKRGKNAKKLQKAVFKLDDTVRITRKKHVFQKGYEQTFSYEIFFVNEVKPTYPITYGIKDYKGEVIQGSFYKEELQLVDKSDNIYPIERIVRQRKRNNEIEYLVKFVGYSEDANTWIPQNELFNAS